MAVAIIGGTITSTILTLLVVPTFYDSIEIAHDHALEKFRRRSERWNPLTGFVLTFLEAILALLLLRFVYRMLMKGLGLVTGRRAPAAGAIKATQV
jgi:hypothetical protein